MGHSVLDKINEEVPLNSPVSLAVCTFWPVLLTIAPTLFQSMLHPVLFTKAKEHWPTMRHLVLDKISQKVPLNSPVPLGYVPFDCVIFDHCPNSANHRIIVCCPTSTLSAIMATPHQYLCQTHPLTWIVINSLRICTWDLNFTVMQILACC